jgi:hypothetical protein
VCSAISGRARGGGRLVRVPRRLPESLEPREVATFVADLRTARDRAIALLMLLGGLRTGEVRALRLAEVDQGLRRVRVTGKGGRQRVVPVDAAFFTELATYLRTERPPGCRTAECFVDVLRQAAAAKADPGVEELPDPVVVADCVRGCLTSAPVASHSSAIALMNENGEHDHDGEGQPTRSRPRDRSGPAERIQAALAEVAAQEEARHHAQQQRESSTARRLERAQAGESVVARIPRGPHRLAEAQTHLDREVARQQAKLDRPPVPVEQHPHVLRARKAVEAALAEQPAAPDQSGAANPVANTTDPQSRLMPTRCGFVQGYNAQVAVTPTRSWWPCRSGRAPTTSPRSWPCQGRP